MSERKPEGHPLVVMASGGFIGGLFYGGTNGGDFLTFVFLTLAPSFALLYIFGHIRKESWDTGLAVVIGLSTTIPLPAGFIGGIIGKALWGN